MTILKARIGELPLLIRGFYKVVFPLSIVLLFLYFFEIYLISKNFHRIFMVIPLFVAVLFKRFDHLLAKKVEVAFCEDCIKIDELKMDLPFSEISGVELTVSGYKGEVFFGGTRPTKQNGYGNILRLQLNEGGTLPLNIFLDDPNDEVVLVKCCSKMPDSDIKRLYQGDGR